MAGNQSSNWNRDRDREPNRDRDRDRDRFDARRRSFTNWYVSTYPGWLGYPYLIDPGFYDWGDADDSTSDQGATPDFAAPYPDQGYGDPGPYPQPDYAGDAPPWIAPNQQPNAGELTVASMPEPEEPLTVIFKSGRAPLKVQNYMMTAKVLTDLDFRHYQQIPLDEIDLAATQSVNTTAGVEFQVPSASHD